MFNAGTGTSRLSGLPQRNAGAQEPADSAHVYLLLRGADRLTKGSRGALLGERRGGVRDRRPGHTELALAAPAVGWFTGRDPPSRPDRALRPRLRDVLTAGGENAAVPEELRRKAADALASLPVENWLTSRAGSR